MERPELAIYASVNEVAAAARVSEATVMRLCRLLGFRGFQDFKIALARELVTPIKRLHEEVAPGDDPATIVHKVFQANLAALQDTLAVLDMEAMAAAAQDLRAARLILLIGVGTSGPIVEDAANKFFRLGLLVRAVTDAHLMMMAAALLTPADVVVAVSHSGSTRDTVETAGHLHHQQLLVAPNQNRRPGPGHRLPGDPLPPGGHGLALVPDQHPGQPVHPDSLGPAGRSLAESG